MPQPPEPSSRRSFLRTCALTGMGLLGVNELLRGQVSAAEVLGSAGPDPEVQASAPVEDTGGWDGRERVGIPIADDSLVAAKKQLNEAVEELLGVIRSQDVLDAIGPTDRANLAKYLTIAKLRLENAIAVVRTGDTDR